MKGLWGKNRLWILVILVICSFNNMLKAVSLTVEKVVIDAGATGSVIVSGDISNESTFGYTIQIEIIPRDGNLGMVTFTQAPPSDIEHTGDPWPGVGTFSSFDTDLAGSILFNGVIDDNGVFIPSPVTFFRDLAEFPIFAGADAVGVWDVTLSTSAGSSSWEGLNTTLLDGSITVWPRLTAIDLLMPPDAVSNVAVSGWIGGFLTSDVTLYVELVPRAGAIGTVMFTPAPPEDITQLNTPWPGNGAFSVFDTDSTGSTTLNSFIADNGTRIPGPVTFSGLLARFPIVSSADTDGVWDVLLATSAGDSSWDGLTTTLRAGTVTVTTEACIENADCDDADHCTSDTCRHGYCVNDWMRDCHAGTDAYKGNRPHSTPLQR